MSAYIITTAWCKEADEDPWLVDSYDEAGNDTWNGEPEHFVNAIASVSGDIRIVKLVIDLADVKKLYVSETIEAAIWPTEETP
jgi:hypothetical protein